MALRTLRPMMFLGILVLVAFAGFAPAARAANYHVPSVPTPTLQDAVDDALASADPQETIYIDSDLDVFAETVIPFGFNAGHKLLIRPGTTLLRARIRMQACCDPVIRAVGTSFVTLQDLDIFRHITNGDHIIYYDGCAYMLIQRCRIGSDWTVPGAQNFSAIYWVYPFNSMIRNTITFATAPSTWRHGIDIVNHDDPGSKLWLYNNSIQGFYDSGISLFGTAGKIMLRNNVVVTEESINPDPVGYWGNLAGGVWLVSSHNAVFCDPGDEWGGFDDIRGGNFAQLNFADIPPSFVSWIWTPDSWNPAFLSLTAAGPLHTAARFGQNLTGGMPDPDDQQVLDDWEHEVRPSGAPPHTDRGADQSDVDGTSSVASSESVSPLDLVVTPVPSSGRMDILLRAPGSSEVATVRLFDSSGRLAREVWQGEIAGRRSIAWENPGLPAGVYFLSVTRGQDREIRRVILVQ